MEPATQDARVDRLFETLGLERTAQPCSPDATLRPGDLGRHATAKAGPGARRRGVAQEITGEREASSARTVSVPPIENLPSVALGERTDPPSAAAASSVDLIVAELLGEGGMGVVHAADQRSLDRVVAIKRPLQGKSGGGSLVEEARTMARVEHPNVVPVYSLGRDVEQRPVLVMKRVQGASFRELLANADHAAWPRLVARWGDRERASLGILGEVADALTLAHARDIVHRDVKPENVMVGEFGEVYLLDWGIATPVKRRDESDTEPSGDIVGTPGYMAPEMVLDPDSVDGRTDVYLLGATLHQVLTGKLRHRGESFYQTLASAMESVPVVYGPEVPEDLAALANLATSSDPDQRPPSAAAFRLALTEHDRHREALGLVRTARESLGPLLSGALPLASEEAASLLSEAGAAIAAVYKSHPASAAVRAARTEHLVLTVERDLALESPGAARAALSRLEAPRPDLTARVEELERGLARAKASEEQLARARAEADTREAMRPRTVLLLVALLPVVALSAFLSATELTGPLSIRHVATTDVVALSLAMLGTLLGRRYLLANRGNRMLTAYVLGAMGCVVVLNFACVVADTEVVLGVALVHLLIGAYTLSGAILLTPSFGWNVANSVVVAGLMLALPQWFEVLSPLGSVGMIAAGVHAIRTYAKTQVDGEPGR